MNVALLMQITASTKLSQFKMTHSLGNPTVLRGNVWWGMLPGSPDLGPYSGKSYLGFILRYNLREQRGHF